MKWLKKSVLLFVTLSAFVGPNALANDAMMSMIKNMKLDKAQISAMIDKMQASGKISAEDAKKAKAELSGMSEKDMNSLKDKAAKKIQSGQTK